MFLLSLILLNNKERKQHILFNSFYHMKFFT